MRRATVARMRLAALVASLRSGEATPSDHVEDVLRRLDDLAGGPWDNLVAARDDGRARRDAAVATAELRAGRRRGPLHGVAVAVKDNVDVEGVPTRLGSHASSPAPAARDAAVVAALREAGAVVVAKAHLHELAYGSTGAVNAAGPARNPHDPGRITGGSSSGPAALVALGTVALAVGTDTGCSVRAPAALCGVTGLMPGLGVLPTDGVVPLSTTLDHVGLIATDARGADLALRALRSPAPATTAPAGPHDPDPDVAVVRGVRVGLPRGDLFAVHDPAVEAAVQRSAATLRAAGATVVEVEVPALAALAAAYPVVVGSEAHATHAGLLGREPGLQEPTARRLRQQADRRALDYLRALRAMLAARDRALHQLREEHALDHLLLATTPVRATPLGVEEVGGEAVASALLRLCVPFSALGVAAVSVPAPDVSGLPVGLQVVGVRADEAAVLALARTATSPG